MVFSSHNRPSRQGLVSQPLTQTHRYIWTLCGFGYMLDLLWAQAFGLALGPLEQELGFGSMAVYTHHRLRDG